MSTNPKQNFWFSLIGVAALAIAAVLYFFSQPKEFAPAGLRVDSAYLQTSAPSAKSAAAYFTLINDGDETARLIAVRADIAGQVMLHGTEVDGDGVARMRMIKGGIEIPAQGRITLEPGGMHVMLMGLTQSLDSDEPVPLTLEFDPAAELEIMVETRIGR